MRVIPEHLRGVFTTRRYTNPRLSYLTLPVRYLMETDEAELHDTKVTATKLLHLPSPVHRIISCEPSLPCHLL